MRDWRKLLWMAAMLAGCATQPLPPAPPTTPAPPQPCPCPPTEVKPEVPPAAPLQRADWDELTGWPGDQLGPSFEGFLASCKAMARRAGWGEACQQARNMDKRDLGGIRQFFESRFTPYRATNPDGGNEGLITGYYEPLLNGNTLRDSRNRFPLYGVPDDLLIVDLADIYPELKGMRLRGRIEGRKVVPYFSREQIESGDARLAGRELAWVDDAVELFFLQIQGSGRVRLPSGKLLRVGYADQNGYPYKAVGKVLVDRGELPAGQVSMQAIQAWAQKNPDKLNEVLNANPSYVFFRELGNADGGPLGALGVPLTDGASIAVDARYIPLGAPVFLAATWPNSDRPLARLMNAQDTGGAIRGVVRADFFWGFGREAGQLAGRMKQRGRLWVLLPNDMAPPKAAN